MRQRTLANFNWGYFNIIKIQAKKNNDKFETRWSFLFNAIIDSLDLRDLDLSGRRFTWANSLPKPTYERLDRVLVSKDREQHFPLAIVTSLSREISDHTPLLLDTRDSGSANKQQMFKFELGWLLIYGFLGSFRGLAERKKREKFYVEVAK